MPDAEANNAAMLKSIPWAAKLNWPQLRVAAAALGHGEGMAIAAVAAVWLLLFYEVHDEWALNPQYGYGYLVPLLGSTLLWLRWQDRPAMARGSRTEKTLIIAGALLVFLFPLRLVFQANPEWRLLYWTHGLLAWGLSACLLYYVGGWRSIWFFSPALLFMLIAVPWPMAIEQTFTQTLMRVVAGFTVAVADWLGIPAVQHGNLVEVGAGVVGIDEACSGVRSLQSALMLSLFLGEMYRFSWLRRLVLFAGSMLFVLVANICRTTFLVWAAASRGLGQMEAWHDSAGRLVMFIVLPGLIVLAFMMKPRTHRAAPARIRVQSAFPPIPRWLGVGALCWLVTIEAACEAWYRIHETRLVANAQWSVAWPERNPGFKLFSLPEKSLAILRCSESSAASWRDEQENRWNGFFLHWAPGKNSAQLAAGHRPDICFPAAGAHLVSNLGLILISADGLDIPFCHQLFENGGSRFHVFYCLWSDKIGPNETPLPENASQPSRWKAVLAGKRHLGQQVLELVLEGPDSDAVAVSLLQAQVSALIRLKITASLRTAAIA